MNTPICDFVNAYLKKEPLRLHTPGHKGKGAGLCEALDITEIPGADSLYAPEGIILESEQNAARLFGTRRTLYSCEGSSLSIRAMVFLAVQYARKQNRPPVILAGRNAHCSFLSAAALLGVQVRWLPCGGYLSGTVSPQSLLHALQSEKTPPTAVYITSPDYLGGMADLPAVSALCRQFGTLLMVDNAHGAYLRFLKDSIHPMDAGADLCADSAHKTLPALTGTGYLHIGFNAPAGMEDAACQAMSLFGSTSPSYLLLQSLDRLNRLLAEGWPETLQAFLSLCEESASRLKDAGWRFAGQEPLKWTICPKQRGYAGEDLIRRLTDAGIVCEYADPDAVVMLLSPQMGKEGLSRLEKALLSLPPKPKITMRPPALPPWTQVMDPLSALLAPQEMVPVAQAEGRICGAVSIACPPAVPIVVSGERICAEALPVFRYYGVQTVSVVLEE